MTDRSVFSSESEKSVRGIAIADKRNKVADPKTATLFAIVWHAVIRI